MHLRTAFVLIAAATAALATGCSSSDSSPPAGETRASLHRAKGCGDLLSDLKADASWKVNQGIDLQIASIRKCIDVLGDVQQCSYYGGPVGYATGGGVGAPPESDAKASGSTTGSAPVPSGASSDSAASYSETNTQVKGVDEADIIKNDGKNLYVLHGNAFKVINAWPANDLREISSTDVEGSPQEMFVADGRVVIYSQVNGASIFTAAGVTPRDAYQDYVYYPAGGGGGAMIANDARPAPAPYPGGTAEPYYPLTKMTVMSLDAAGKTQVQREIYFEGGYLDARRVGAQVRTVLEGGAHGPKLKYGIYDYQTDVAYTPPANGSEMIAALEQLRRDNLTTIEGSTLSDWLPYTFVKDGAAVKAHNVACEDFYIPSIGSTESGMTEIASLDLSDAAAQPKETAILGAADTVYGSEDTLYLASRAWVEPPVMWMDGTGYAVASTGTVSAGSTGGGVATKTVGPAAPPGEIISWATNKTHLHKFDFTTDPTFPNYQASGTVVGNVKDQFSLDDKDGYLRVATTESRGYVEVTGKYVPFDSSRPNTANHVFTLKQNGPWLDTQGDVGDLAANEQIRSVRFLGNRGYVVTFRQVDPLFVVDLSNQAKPNVLAALKIPGFSEYMHPLDENHLLTIGRDANQAGLALQIFDVTDGTSPKLMQKFAYTGSQYGSSEAEYDHKAFTYFADKSLLAFPYYSNGYDATTGTYSAHSTLEIFKVDVASGFAYLGAMDHSSFIQKNPTGYCGGTYAPSVRRGVFLENFAYSISYGGVVSKDVNALGGAGTSFALEAPVVNTGYGPACY